MKVLIRCRYALADLDLRCRICVDDDEFMFNDVSTHKGHLHQNDNIGWKDGGKGLLYLHQVGEGLVPY